MKPKIKYVEWGIANNFGSYIEIHKDLPKHPNLYQSILAHELAHTNKKWSIKDFELDFFTSQSLNRWEIYKFMLTRPKTWIQFLPFYYQKDKGLVVDINKCIVWTTTFSFLAIILLIIIKFDQGRI